MTHFKLYPPSDSDILLMNMVDDMSSLVGAKVDITFEIRAWDEVRRYALEWIVGEVRYLFIHVVSDEELTFLMTRPDYMKLIFIPRLEDEFLDFLKRENYVI